MSNAIADIAGTVISSGTPWGQIIGLAGGIGSGILGYFQTKRQNAHELAMRQEDMKLLLAQANADQAKLAAELAKSRQEGADAAYSASVNADAKLPRSWRWVDGFRAITRPGLTWFFVIAFYALASCIIRGVGIQYLQHPLGVFIFTTTANLMDLCVTWWFGQRQMDKMTVEWGNKMVNARVAGSSPTPSQPTK